jgi:hypothetical protein
MIALPNEQNKLMQQQKAPYPHLLEGLNHYKKLNVKCLKSGHQITYELADKTLR